MTDAITANSQIEILCLLDTDANRIARCEKALTERLMELTARTGQFYKGNLSRGDLLESDASIVIIGDVGAARVSAHGAISSFLARWRVPPMLGRREVRTR